MSRYPIVLSAMGKTTLFLLVLSYVSLFSTCGISQYDEIARESTKTLHEMMAAGEYEAVYDSADETFRQGLSRAASQRSLSALKAKLRGCSATKLIASTVNVRPNGTVVVRLQYQHECPDAQATETMDWRITDGRGYLLYYEVNTRERL